MDLETEVQKPGFADGLALGAGYFIDPLGRMLQNFENVAVSGQPLRKTYSRTLFERLSEKAHTGNSLGKYVGAGIGILAAATTLAVASIPYATMAIGTFAYDIYATTQHERRPIPQTNVPTFGQGFKGGFGIGIDPAGYVLENLERNLVNGKGIDENRVVSVAQYMTREARQGNSVAKYVGGLLGFGIGTLVSTVTVGLVPIATGIYDVLASLGNRPVRSVTPVTA